VLPLRYTLEEETLMVQPINADCEQEEVGELGAVKYCEAGVCLGREFSMCATEQYFVSEKWNRACVVRHRRN